MNGTFRKLGAVLIAAAAMLTALPTVSAQSGYTDTFKLPSTPATSGAFKGVDPTGAQITMWYQFTGATKTAFDNLVTQFNQTNPWKITLTATAKGSYDQVYQAILGAIQTKSLPDFSIAYQNQAATYETAGVVLDLASAVNDPVYGIGDAGKADIIPGVLSFDQNPQFNNQQLSFPEYRSLEVLFYNIDALKKLGFNAPPKTWDEFKTMTCAYKKATGNVAYEVRTDASWVAGAAFAQGGDIYDAKSGKFTYNTPEAEIGPQTMQDLLNQGCVGLIANPTAFSDENDFIAGKTIFYGGSTSGMINFVKAPIQKSANPFAFSVAPLPYKDKPVSNIYGASWSAYNSGNQSKELAAWLFMRWFSEPAQQAVWAQKSGYFPIRLSAKDQMTDFLTANPEYAAGYALLSSVKSEPPLSGYQPIRDEAGNAVNDVLDGQNVKQRFTALNDKANQILASYKPNLTPNTPVPATAAATAPAAAATMAPTAAATKSS